MGLSKYFTINGYQIEYVMIFDFEQTTRGVVINPETANFDDPDFINAIKSACEEYETIENIVELDNLASMYRRGVKLDEKDTNRAIWLYNSVKNSPVPIKKETIYFVNHLQSKISKNKAVQSKRNRDGFVYLTQSPSGMYKIGHTKNPDNRMATFSVKLPFEIDYVCLIKTDDMKTLENSLHKKFEHKRVSGEFFNLSEEDIEYIKSL